jgi:hypothetical protein
MGDDMVTRIRLAPALLATATLLIVTVAGAADRVVLGEYFTNLY